MLCTLISSILRPWSFNKDTARWFCMECKAMRLQCFGAYTSVRILEEKQARPLHNSCRERYSNIFSSHSFGRHKNLSFPKAQAWDLFISAATGVPNAPYTALKSYRKECPLGARAVSPRG